MSEVNKKVLLEVDKNCYSLIEEYSRYMEESEDKILNRLLDHSLRECAIKYINLKQGYKEMGKRNLEISKEFIVSENEVFNRIDDSFEI
ncbi:MAG: hypothetical protein L0I93_03580 [Atopostipes suicloacalis]|nr:hypothetical protein [Atopostipes suicloacalis]